MSRPILTIRELRTRAVVVPMERQLHTRIATFDKAPFLLIDLETEEGVTGHAYLFGYLNRGTTYMAAILRDILATTKGQRIAPVDQYTTIEKSLTLAGHQGLATMAASGFDIACWDALSKARGLPLVRQLGGTVQSIRAYNSNGLGLSSPEAVAEEAIEFLADRNFDAVKVRIGRETLAEDIQTIRAVRKAVGDDVILPTDFNQGLNVSESIHRGQALDQEGVYWIEEPIRYDDLLGYAKITREVKTPIQLGENFYGPKTMADAIRANAGDYMMPDLQRIGGVTGWLRAAALTEAAGIDMSSHLFPEVSCHLLAVTPTRHWLEYVNWAEPVLAEPLELKNGHALIPDRPGTGVEWNEEAVSRYQVEL